MSPASISDRGFLEFGRGGIPGDDGVLFPLGVEGAADVLDLALLRFDVGAELFDDVFLIFKEAVQDVEVGLLRLLGLDGAHLLRHARFRKATVLFQFLPGGDFVAGEFDKAFVLIARDDDAVGAADDPHDAVEIPAAHLAPDILYADKPAETDDAQAENAQEHIEHGRKKPHCRASIALPNLTDKSRTMGLFHGFPG
ncbi:MAG: hypothetical protein LIQ30_02850 [Planctomycetes bacterium]|nr:hypothetical protein [Planctomycetota bacterium]MCD7898064.1 hypothetical protein [Planctomycetaceae bacterium]